MRTLQIGMVTVGIGLALAQGVVAMEPGSYAGLGPYGETLSVTVEGGQARVEVLTEGCLGEVQGALSPVASGRWMMQSNEEPGCSVTFEQSGTGFSLRETEGCFMLHGMGCTFDGTVTPVAAQAGAAEATQASAAEAPPAAMDRWTYGVDPELGLSAHIRTAEGAVGLACIAEDDGNFANVEILSLRMSSGLIAPGGSVYLFDAPLEGRGLSRVEGQAFGEVRDTTCGVSLEAFQRAESVAVVEGMIASVSAGAAGLEMVIDQGGRQVTLTEGMDAAAELGGRRITLRGSSAAIGAMLRDCPMAQRDIEAECGL